MLPAKFRLKINNGTISSWKDKSSIFAPSFKSVYHFNKGGTTPKIGFIVTGKVGKAVERNRLRRLLQEVVRNKIEAFPKDIETVFIASRKTKEPDYEDISGWIDQLLSKIKNQRP